MNDIDKIMEEMSDKASDSANYFGSVISLEDAQEILERHLKPSKEKGEKRRWKAEHEHHFTKLGYIDLKCPYCKEIIKPKRSNPKK